MLREINVERIYLCALTADDGGHNISKRFRYIIQKRPIKQAYGGYVFHII